MLVNATEMLIKARDGHYGVPQFNINNLEWTKAVLTACEEMKSPVILGVSKININTECQLVFAEATRKYIEAGKDQQGKGFDPRKLLAPGAQAIIDKCKEKIELFGCAGKG